MGKTGADPGYRSAVFASRDLFRRVVYAVGITSAESRGSSAVAQRLASAVSRN
ncbi:hypothetical protein ACFY8W_00355 [Streptomyces sp. NPDC012637]|uniref:hypothetical protein n=1 Tax=Streptomyces sp. NPDC012637 TaxID=3364842 RepID=UPI0036EAA92E